MGLIGRPGPHSMDERGPTAPGCPLPAFKLSNCDRILQHWAQRSRAEEVRPQWRLLRVSRVPRAVPE